MSLRRPFRDSWEQKEYKRPARFLSPPAEKPSWTPIHRSSPSSERSDLVSVQAAHDSKTSIRYISPTVEDDADSSDDYTERPTLTPRLEPQVGHKPASKDESSTELEPLFGQAIQPRWSAPPVSEPSGEFSQLFDFASSAATVATVSPNASDTAAQSSRPVSDPSTIYPEDSISNVASISSASVSAKALVTEAFSGSSTVTPTPPPNMQRSRSDAERQLLQSLDFPVHLLRPVPNLVTLLTQITPVIGDPGTGPVRFGNAATNALSPTQSIFHQWTTAKEQEWYGEYDPLKDSILKEKPVDGVRGDHLQWERDMKPFDIASYVPSASRTRASERSTATTTSKSSRSNTSSKAANTHTNPQAWKGRQYSVNPALKTRHLSIDLLEHKISHGELLSLSLSVDARRDAIGIGGAPTDIGGSLLSDTARGASKQGGLGTGPASGTRRMTSATIRASSASRARDAARNASMSVASGSRGHTRSSRSADRARRLASDEYDPAERRYRAGHVSTAFDTGRYGIGGVMLWRLVRVAALVHVDGGKGEEEHVAWWCVPERGLGGFF